MSGEMMTFPSKWEQFLHDYEFEDARRVYTNGSRLIPSFRVKQMMEHYAPSVEQTGWYGVVRWCAEDVIAAAEQNGVTLTEAQAEKWLEKNESREFETELELKARVATRDIDDIMCAALEGGITGWCRAAKPVGKMLGEYGHEQIARGGSLMLYDAESSDKWELTLDKFLRGLALAIESGAPVTIDAESGYIDTSDVDAECADMIIQFALFGDLVFG